MTDSIEREAKEEAKRFLPCEFPTDSRCGGNCYGCYHRPAVAARIAELRRALAPFAAAKWAGHQDRCPTGPYTVNAGLVNLEGDARPALEAARAALEQK